MKLITKSMLINDIAKKWRKQYPNGNAVNDAIYKKLCRLPKSATENDISEIIGNSSWTANVCDECKRDNNAVVMLGDKPDYESNTASICQQCLSDALLISYTKGNDHDPKTR